MGAAAFAAGACWLAQIWAGWPAGPPVAKTLGALAIPFVLPAVAQVALRGRLMIAGYAVTAVAVLAWALVYDPFLDLGCWRTCSRENMLLVGAWPQAARTLDLALAAFAVVFGLVTAAVAAAGYIRMSPASRRTRGVVLPSCAVAVAAWAGHGAARLAGPPESTSSPIHQAFFFATAAGLTLLAGALGWAQARAWLRRAAVTRLAQALGSAPPPGSLEAALRRMTGDPSLTVAYWLPLTGRYVDSTGAATDAAPRPGQVATSVVRDGAPIAVICHDPGGRELTERIGAAARLAIENERLRAEVLAQMADLRRSRARVVEAGDEARRRLERDLHDGAQQRLLALTYDLRLALADAPGDTTLAHALDEAQTALRELRELAHGIFPAILHEAGLGSALWSLADQAPVPVEVGEAPAGRLAPAVEQAMYLLAKYAFEAAGGPLAVAVMEDGGTLTLQVDGRVPPVPSHLADRVAALGGRLTITPDRLVAIVAADSAAAGS
ncbi:histidine kinase [Nonomuraea sp. 10N515B]|uniref:histidine kinase n=1 Tax=Nonomuraea sp. 10N515B TaxID=3457422 RepID=UPI003FCED4C7